MGDLAIQSFGFRNFDWLLWCLQWPAGAGLWARTQSATGEAGGGELGAGRQPVAVVLAIVRPGEKRRKRKKKRKRKRRRLSGREIGIGWVG